MITQAIPQPATADESGVHQPLAFQRAQLTAGMRAADANLACRLSDEHTAGAVGKRHQAAGKGVRSHHP